MYEDIGLNPFLQPNNSPITNYGQANVTGYDFDANYERGAITNTKVQGITADKIAAGTVTVAMNLGTNVGSAYILLDGANNRIVVNDGTTNRIVIGNV